MAILQRPFLGGVDHSVLSRKRRRRWGSRRLLMSLLLLVGVSYCWKTNTALGVVAAATAAEGATAPSSDLEPNHANDPRETIIHAEVFPPLSTDNSGGGIVAATATKMNVNQTVPLITNDTKADDSSAACSLWHYEGWILAGKNYSRGEEMGWRDVFIAWQSHPVFLKWRRRRYFSKSHEDDNNATNLIFAPAWNEPWAEKCHERFWNTKFDNDASRLEKHDYSTTTTTTVHGRSSRLSPTLRTTRPISMGDPVFLPCRTNTDYVPDVQSREQFDDFPRFDSHEEMTTELQRRGKCLSHSNVRIASSSTQAMMVKSDASAGWGSFAARSFRKGESIISGPVIHIHRNELLTNNYSEGRASSSSKLTYPDEIINYCFGHPDSNLLLLPNFYGANTIQPAPTKDDVNVVVKWQSCTNNKAGDPKIGPECARIPSLFSVGKPTQELFGDTDLSQLSIQIVTLRDLGPGDELLLDFGADWIKAWKDHQEKHHKYGTNTVFRHEIGVPKEFFPSQWIDIERKHQYSSPFMAQDNELPRLDLSRLQPGQIEKLMVKDATGSYSLSEDGIYRVRLPTGFVDAMENWITNKMGLTDILRSYVLGDMDLFESDDDDGREDLHSCHGAPIEEEGQRIAGGDWWITRVEKSWQSNMHYATPDDEMSYNQFLEALLNAGFRDVLKSIGKSFGLNSLSCYFLSLRAASYSGRLHLHSDSDNVGVFNLLFSILQADPRDATTRDQRESSYPELIVADDTKKAFYPYRYERDHALVLHKDGYHGTAPYDLNDMRMILSAHCGDFSDPDFRRGFVERWEGFRPDYPLEEHRDEFLRARRIWEKDAPTPAPAPADMSERS